MNYAVATHSLSKVYSRKTVINNVDIHIPQGSVYGFVGHNGSGKTTIMRILMGLASPTKGTYELFGVDYKNSAIFNVRQHITAIVEAPSLVPTMTAFDNLKYACTYYGITDFSIIDKVLKQVGLENTGKKKVKNFSLGMRQRLGIAVLLLNNPKMMLLDEPMNGLDPAGIAELRDLIIDLNKQGITFMISSHILSELEKVATYYGFISQGKLIKEISAEDMIAECQKGTDIRYENLDKLEEALKELDLSYKRNIVNIRVFDEIKPIELLTKLESKGITISDIKTVEGNVEDYYLSLIGGNQND